MRAGWREDLRAMPLLYFPIAIWAGLARVQGWTEGLRQQHSETAGPP